MSMYFNIINYNVTCALMEKNWDLWFLEKNTIKATLVKKIELFSAEKDPICVSDAKFCRIFMPNSAENTVGQNTVRFFLQQKNQL